MEKFLGNFRKFWQNFMPAVHSCQVHLARVSNESCLRRHWVNVTLYTLAESSPFWHVTRGNSQVRKETVWLMHHGLLKKRDLNEARHEHRGYTRGSKARRVFPSTFSLSLVSGSLGESVHSASYFLLENFKETRKWFLMRLQQISKKTWNWFY